MDKVEYLRQWRAENPEKQREYNERHKIYQKKNRKRISAKERKYWQAHPKEKLAADRRYKAKLRKERPWLLWHRNTKDRCRNKCLHYIKLGIKYFLSAEEMKSLWFRDKAYNLTKPSIDRINTIGHYTFDNCQFIELSENMHKKKRVYHQ